MVARNKGHGHTDNPWNKFLEAHRDDGLSLEELRKLYLSESPEAPPVYLYDDSADINHGSILQAVLDDRKLFPDGIGAINRKLSDYEEVTDKESEAWLLSFELALTDDYGLSTDQLLSSHDWWLKRLEIESGMETSEFSEIVDQFKTTDYDDIDEFISDVKSVFDIYQLYRIKYPELS